MDRRELRNELLSLLKEAGRAAKNGNIPRVRQLLDALRSREAEFDGWPLAMVETAVIAVEEIAGSPLSPQEMAIRAFLAEHGDLAYDALERLLDHQRVDHTTVAGWTDEAGRAFRALVDLGVVNENERSFSMGKQFYRLARDLVEPTMERDWRLLQEARNVVIGSRLDQDGAVGYFQTHLGFTAGRAARHWRRHPHVRPPVPAVEFRREGWVRSRTESPPTSQENADPVSLRGGAAPTLVVYSADPSSTNVGAPPSPPTSSVTTSAAPTAEWLH